MTISERFVGSIRIKGEANVDSIVDWPKGLGDISRYVYPFILLKDFFVNSTAAFVGSITFGIITASDIDCCNSKAKIHINGTNVSNTSSASHLKCGQSGTAPVSDN